ncbi:MAG: DinB family protein [Acidobacteriota bacterium]|nr:DinB family protein [Acidobacteriota bacterium]
MIRTLLSLSLLAGSLAAPLLAQQDNVKDTFLKHLKTSRDFTLKVAEAMPAADYDFKLTKPQMSFAEQMVHLSQGLSYFTSPFMGEKPNPSKPASMSKADVIAFVKAQFDKAIDEVSKLTPEQLSKTYKSEEGTETGLELLMGMLDHNTHHRACAEMYLRAKGITPPEYQS